jgi:hypothetical protein
MTEESAAAAADHVPADAGPRDGTPYRCQGIYAATLPKGALT